MVGVKMRCRSGRRVDTHRERYKVEVRVKPNDCGDLVRGTSYEGLINRDMKHTGRPPTQPRAGPAFLIEKFRPNPLRQLMEETGRR
jgi:hypothetical protein